MLRTYRKSLCAFILALLYISLPACSYQPKVNTASSQIQPKKQAEQIDNETQVITTPIPGYVTKFAEPARQPAAETPKLIDNTNLPTPQAESTPQPIQAGAAKQDEAEELYNKGFQEYLGGNYDGAIDSFDLAIRADSSSYKAYNGKGIALCFKGKYQEGMSLIKKALEIKPDFAYSNFNMAMAYKLQKNFDQSLIWFDKAISYDPNDAWSYYGIASIYGDRGDQAKTLQFLIKAISLDPGAKDAAKEQSHFDSVRNNPEFIELVR